MSQIEKQTQSLNL